MSIAVIGASSNLAGMALEQVIENVPASELTLVTRNPAKLAAWSDRGATVLEGSAKDPALLARAFEGKRRVLLISGLNIGSRLAEHVNVINAAKKAGVGHITYTSTAGAHKVSPVPSAGEHIATEMKLWDSGLSFAALRSQSYFMFYFNMLSRGARVGSWRSLCRDGKVSPVAESDIAASIAGILLDTARHDRVVYEITGPELLTFPQICRIGEEVFGKPIEYVPLTVEEQYADFKKMGFSLGTDLSKPVPLVYGAEETVQQWIAHEQGLLEILSGHVEFITGRKPIDLMTYLKQRIAAESAAGLSAPRP